MASGGELERLLLDFKKKVAETGEKNVSPAPTNVENIHKILERLKSYKNDPTAAGFIDEITGLKERSVCYPG